MFTTQEAWTEYQQISQLEEQLHLLKSMLCDISDEDKACALGSAVRIMEASLEQR